MQKQTMKILTSIIAMLPFLIGSTDAQKLPASTTIGTNPARHRLFHRQRRFGKSD